jgi:hypothetical protein
MRCVFAQSRKTGFGLRDQIEGMGTEVWPVRCRGDRRHGKKQDRGCKEGTSPTPQSEHLS